MQNDVIYAIYGDDGRAMTYKALCAADAKALIPSKESAIAIKPNLVVAKPAEEGATTHPGVVEGIIDYLFENGYRNVSIIESSWVGDSTIRAYSQCGYKELSRRTGVPLYDLKADDSVSIQSGDQSLRVCKRAAEADFLINVPVLKAHCQTQFTCALKNLKGIIPDSEKRRYHTLGIHKPVALLNAAIKAQLHVIDALCGDLTFEEGGNPVPMNMLLLGCDPVMLDSYGAMLIGLAPDEVQYITMAQKLGVGRLFTGGELMEINRPEQGSKQFSLNRKSSMLLKEVKQDQACSACLGALVHALNRTNGSARMSGICIGQGYRNTAGDGIGIGSCCSQFDKHVKGCPPSAKDILDFLESHSG